MFYFIKKITTRCTRSSKFNLTMKQDREKTVLRSFGVNLTFSGSVTDHINLSEAILGPRRVPGGDLGSIWGHIYFWGHRGQTHIFEVILSFFKSGLIKLFEDTIEVLRKDTFCGHSGSIWPFLSVIRGQSWGHLKPRLLSRGHFLGSISDSWGHLIYFWGQQYIFEDIRGQFEVKSVFSIFPEKGCAAQNDFGRQASLVFASLTLIIVLLPTLWLSTLFLLDTRRMLKGRVQKRIIQFCSNFFLNEKKKTSTNSISGWKCFSARVWSRAPATEF